MPEFVFTSPEGKTIRITGPEGSTPEQAFQMLAQSGKIGAQQPEQDPIRATVSNELEALKKSGAPVGDGAGRQFLQGATFGFGDELLAGATTPLEMIKRGTFNPREAYKYAKAREDLLLEGARKNGGVAGTVAEIAGGAATGGALARGGATLLRAGQGLLPRAGALAGEGAAFGAINAAGEAKDISAIPGDALKGAAVGGVIGGGLGAVAPIVNAVGRNAMGWASATMNPKGFAQKQVARALMESGRTPQQIAGEIADAGAMGQPFTVADAMGNAGQRMASNVARAPGAGRTQMTEFLDARQAEQGSRIATIFDDALGTGPTARQTSKALMQKAARDSAPLYQRALGEKFVWTPRVQQFFDDPVTQQGLARGFEIQRLEALKSGIKFDPKDYGIIGVSKEGKPILGGVPNMRTIDVVKNGFDDMLEKYRDPVTRRLNLDQYGRALENVRSEFLKTIDNLNPYYKAARESWAGPASVDEAVGMGGKAANRGRFTDNIDMFNAFKNDAQRQGFRVGWGDNKLASMERVGEGVNKARNLLAPKASNEFAAISRFQGPLAPGQKDMAGKALQREDVMFRTRNEALGGSKTADNLNDQAAAGVSPEIVGNLVSGNLMGAAKNLIGRTSGALSGYTPRVREELAKMLLQTRDPKLLQMLQDISSNDESRRKIAAALLSGVLSGSAPGATAIQRK